MSLQDKGDAEFLENFEVPAERAAQIRAQVARFKDADWNEEIKNLIQELGSEEKILESEDKSLPGLFDKAQTQKVYRAPEGHAAYGLSFVLVGADLKVLHNDISLLEVNFLPKGDDIIVFYLNEARLDELLGYLEALAPQIKEAKAAKGQRQAEWKARFNKA
jgi:hypothetical protein